MARLLAHKAAQTLPARQNSEKSRRDEDILRATPDTKDCFPLKPFAQLVELSANPRCNSNPIDETVQQSDTVSATSVIIFGRLSSEQILNRLWTITSPQLHVSQFAAHDFRIVSGMFDRSESYR
jgi:hypothetical protein